EALLSGSEVLDAEGRAHRRASGAVLLAGAAASAAGGGGPLRRRAELAALEAEIGQQQETHGQVSFALSATELRLAERERAAGSAAAETERARETEREAAAGREDAARVVEHLTRELADQQSGLARLRERLERAAARRGALVL